MGDTAVSVNPLSNPHVTSPGSPPASSNVPSPPPTKGLVSSKGEEATELVSLTALLDADADLDAGFEWLAQAIVSSALIHEQSVPLDLDALPKRTSSYSSHDERGGKSSTQEGGNPKAASSGHKRSAMSLFVPPPPPVAPMSPVALERALDSPTAPEGDDPDSPGEPSFLIPNKETPPSGVSQQQVTNDKSDNPSSPTPSESSPPTPPTITTTSSSSSSQNHSLTPSSSAPELTKTSPRGTVTSGFRAKLKAFQKGTKIPAPTTTTTLRGSSSTSTLSLAAVPAPTRVSPSPSPREITSSHVLKSQDGLITVTQKDIDAAIANEAQASRASLRKQQAKISDDVLTTLSRIQARVYNMSATSAGLLELGGSLSTLSLTLRLHFQWRLREVAAAADALADVAEFYAPAYESRIKKLLLALDPEITSDTVQSILSTTSTDGAVAALALDTAPCPFVLPRDTSTSSVAAGASNQSSTASTPSVSPRGPEKKTSKLKKSLSKTLSRSATSLSTLSSKVSKKLKGSASTDLAAEAATARIAAIENFTSYKGDLYTELAERLEDYSDLKQIDIQASEVLEEVARAQEVWDWLLWDNIEWTVSHQAQLAEDAKRMPSSGTRSGLFKRVKGIFGRRSKKDKVTPVKPSSRAGSRAGSPNAASP